MNNGECVICSAGQKLNEEGMCELCDGGRYQSNQFHSETECNVCEEGTSCPPGTITPNECSGTELCLENTDIPGICCEYYSFHHSLNQKQHSQHIFVALEHR